MSAADTKHLINVARTLRARKAAGALWLAAMLLLSFSLALPASAQSNGYVYVNNQSLTNTVSAYSVSASGSLTQLTGSPFSTGGKGANVTCYGLQRIAISSPNNFMYVANTGDLTISAFQINPATGGLTLVAGSPFASGLTLDSCQGISVAATPDGRFLYAASNGTVKTFTIGASGALSLLTTTATGINPNSGMAISANGQFLAIANQTSVSMFTINTASGLLGPVSGSPFIKTGAGSIAGLDFSCVGDRLYAGEATGSPTTADGWIVNTTTGALTPAPSTPFHTPGNDSAMVLYSPDNSLLFESNQFSNSINPFQVNSNGSLTNTGKFGSTTAVHTPVGMATDASGTFLFVADDAFGVATFRIGPGGTLTSLSDLAITRPGEIQDLVAYPQRSCTSSDLGVTMTPTSALVQPGAPISFLVTITNSGTVPATAVVADTLPPDLVGGGPIPIVTPNGISRSNSVGSTTVTGTVMVTTTLPHQMFAGETVSINSVPAPTTPDLNHPGQLLTDPGFTGVFTVVSTPTPTTFTYTQTIPLSQFPQTNPNNLQPIPGTDTSGGGNATNPTCQIQTGPGSCSTASFSSRAPIAAATATPPGAVRSGNVVTITTTVPHQLFVGQTVTITGVTDTSFNGTFTVTSANSPIQFTYNKTAANASSGGGNIVPTATTAQLMTFPAIGAGKSRTAIITATTKPNAVNGNLILNFAQISNRSVVDTNGLNDVAQSTITIGTQSGTSLSVPTATGPYGGFATLSATLVDSANNPIAGKAIGFNFNLTNNTYSGVTNGSGVATVTVPLSTITVGTHTNAFTVNFAGDGTYNPSSAQGTLIVTKAQLTVTANDQSRLYGDPNPQFTYTITGFVNGDTIAVVSGAADCTTTATQTSPVGTYPITCTQNTLTATNYVFVFVPGTLTINPAPLTVTADNASRAYGAANPAFTGTITGLKNGDNITATYSTTATPASPVGTYPIVPALVDPNNLLGNYTVTINNGTLTVTAAVLIVTANNAARLYGDPNPPFSGSIAGLVNGDNITATYTTTATPASPIGNYPIVPVLSDPNNKLGNYAVTINNGNLVVSPAPLVVTAANATRAYGDPNPVFTGTTTGIKNNDNISATYSTTATQTSPAGTYPIVPTLVDPNNVLGNYSVTINNGTLTVTAAVLTVTAANATRLYGDPNPAFTGTITGLRNGDNITATYSTTADPTSPVGTYAIVPTLVDPNGALVNYQVVINNGVLTITQAPLTVTANNATRVYGDPNPVFTGSIIGLKNGDNITALFSSADPTAAVGTYPIVPTLVDPTNKLGNYSVTINNGVLTVTPAPLSVTAANASRLFGTPNPPFTGLVSGLKNGDNITATYSTTAVATSPAGTYAIVPALVDPAAKLGNYTVTSNNGTLTVNTAPTANFVFVNNQTAANSISSYSVSVDGSLTALSGSPFATGGSSTTTACTAVDRITLSAGNNLLFVSNNGDLSISAFQIDPASGALTAATGSPFASGLTLDSCAGISLAATPDGRFLMASSNGQIKTFSIGAGGVLTLVSTSANPITPNAGMKISANGQFLATADAAGVALFTINFDGSLTQVSGSPFTKEGAGSLAGLDFSSTSGLLYGAESSATGTITDAWTVGANGLLSAITGSPFSTTQNNSSVVLLSPDNRWLFSSNQGSNSVNSFSVAADGSLTSIGSFGSTASLHVPAGMSTDRSGSLLYVADDSFGVAVFRIGGTGSLSQLGDVAIAGAGQVQGLVAYPPRMAGSADVSVAVSASSTSVIAGQNVTYTATITNNGSDPAAATITDALPAGLTVVSCSATGNGTCGATGSNQVASFYLLQSGQSQTVTIVAQTGSTIAAGTVITNTVSISNSSAVDANAANNSASVDITIQARTTASVTVNPASGTYGGNAALSAMLRDSASAPLSGKTLSFTLNGSPAGSAVTDAIGTASVSVGLGSLAAGSYPGAVTAGFAGDATFAPTSGSGDLTVSPAVLTVTAANTSRVYGDANPALTFTLSGFVNGDTSAVVSGSANCTTTADAASNVGNYPITCTTGTLAAANYTFTFVNGTLSITPAALTVTADSTSRLYGDANPTFTGTVTGLKNGDTITATYSTTATPASAVGTYPITPALVDPTNKLGNYTVTSNNGTLTVNPAPLSVVAANAGRFYGDPNPAFTGTITGIKNGDNITATYSTTAVDASVIGTYPIVPTLVDPTGKLGNYVVTSTNGTLTINPAPLTVTAANATRLYGDPNPAFTGTITGIRNGDAIGVSFSSAAVATSPVGTYPIVPALSDPTNKLSNYAVTLNNGTLTVSPAPLTVTAANAGRVYGDPNPAFTGTITGIKNGDNITATYASATDATTAVGTYPIVPTLVDPAGALANYTVTSNNGTLTITQAPLTVTANNASRVYGDPNPTFTGTITGLKNGDNITATYSSVDATAAVGTYTIVPALVDPANKLGNYTVTSSNGTLTLTAAPLTVAADNLSRLYGDPNPTLTGTTTGLKNGETISVTYSTTATQTSAVGTYPIAPAVIDPNNVLGNYSLTVVNGTLTVNPAPLTVAVTSFSRLYGDPNPVFTGSITGIKNGDNITAAFATSADPTSNVGSYPILAALIDPDGKLGNYTVTNNPGTLLVNPAPLNVVAADASRLYGDPNPAFTGAITGIKNGDNITATYAGAADPTSAVGTYPIVPTLVDPANKLGNYTVTSTNGTLTVNPAPLTIQANDATKNAGDPNPAFTGVITGIKNNDNITASYSSPADATSPAGTYPIIPSADPNPLLSNYSITLINGTLTVQ